MRLKIIFLLFFSIAVPFASEAQVPLHWTSCGIGGGGALFSPSINPDDHSEIYMSCDMGEIFSSRDAGASWKDLNYLVLQGGHDACMQFTSDPMIRYCVHYPSVSGIDYIKPMKSTDGGVTWHELSGNPYPDQPNGNILRLLADYDNPDRVMLADYGTIYFSSDGGSTFHLVHTCLSNGAGNHIAGIFFDGPGIRIGTNDGLLVSDDGGNSFSTMPVSGIAQGEYMLSFAGARQGNAIRFFCLTAANVWSGYQYGSDYWNVMKGVYRMDGMSGVWIPAVTGISIGSDFPVFVGMSAEDTGTAYLSGGSSAGSPIVMKSVNGSAWTHVFLTQGNQNIYTGWAGDGGDHGWSFPEAPFGFTVAYNDPSTVMLTDYSCSHITTDGGLTWHEQYLGRPDENPMGASTPKEKTYHSCGLENTSCWQVMWADSLEILAGFSDINGIMSSDRGASWKFIPGLSRNSVYRIIRHPGGMLYAAVSNVHDLYQSTRIYDAQIDAGNGAVYMSADNGSNFTLMHDFGHPVVWIAIDPSDPNRMYASVLHHDKQNKGGIWVTSDLGNGASSGWSKLPPPPRSNGHPFSINVLDNGDLVCSFSARKPSGSSAFTDSSGVFYYSSAASAWYDRSDPDMRFWTQDVVVDPHDSTQSTWYACVFTGWGTAGIQGTGGLFRTTDKGISWTRVSDSYRVNSCTVDPLNAGNLYFTTETDGLWYTSEATAISPHFSRVDSYPFRHPMRVFFNPYHPRETWVSSFGNGIMLGSDSASGTADLSRESQQFTIMPNPCRDKFMLKCLDGSKPAKTSFTISDLRERELMRGFSAGTIDVSGLPAGIYLLKVFFDGLPAGCSKLIRL